MAYLRARTRHLEPRRASGESLPTPISNPIARCGDAPLGHCRGGRQTHLLIITHECRQKEENPIPSIGAPVFEGEEKGNHASGF
jgi:hypothetical protein